MRECRADVRVSWRGERCLLELCGKGERNKTFTLQVNSKEGQAFRFAGGGRIGEQPPLKKWERNKKKRETGQRKRRKDQGKVSKKAIFRYPKKNEGSKQRGEGKRDSSTPTRSLNGGRILWGSTGEVIVTFNEYLDGEIQTAAPGEKEIDGGESRWRRLY